MRLSLNGALTDNASIDAVSAAALYGRGVFTTVAIHLGEPFLWDKHWKRLRESAAKLSIDVSRHPEQTTLRALRELVSDSRLDSGRARVTFFDGSMGPVWQSSSERRCTSLLIVVAETRSRHGRFSLTSSPNALNSTSPLAGVKSCNYLEPVMAYDEAHGRGFGEAIRLNEKGHVASACLANVFWEKDGRLFTPGLSTGCLPGTTREFVLENFECEEVESGIDALGSADRIFLTSAGLGVAAVAEFNERKLDTSDHRLLDLIPA